MTDEEKTPPFQVLTGKDATVGAPPRVGPTMSQINERLGQLEILGQQALKRLQQTALMVDGLGGNLNRRIDVLHEEAALLRVSVTHPANDRGESGLIKLPVQTPAQRARSILAVPVKFVSHATAAAVALRLVAKQFPDYAEAIDAFLVAFGL